MLDIHTHILPNIDDGSRSVAESVAMIRASMEQGVNRLALTPHFYPERESPKRFLERRGESARELSAALAGMKQLPKMCLGAEVAYFEGMSRTEHIDSLCIGRTRMLLVELPFSTWNHRVLDELFDLQDKRGVQLVLAHIDRYLHFQRPGTMRELCERGFWIQASTSFFLDLHTSWLAMRMLRQHKIHFLGSDCHNTSGRVQNMGRAMARIDRRLGPQAIGHLEYMENTVWEGCQ